MSNNKEPIGREEDWIWLQRNPEIVREFDKMREIREGLMRAYLFPLLADTDVVKDHVYDPVTYMENIHIRRWFMTGEWWSVFRMLGWEEKRLVKEDKEEKKDFYDALLKGGSLH